MGKRHNLTILLAFLCLVLICINAYIYINHDRKAPVIVFPEGQLVYTDHTKAAELLQDVTASDDIDGDVTDSLRIYNVTILEDGETAAILYYAKDSSNNIASARRIAVYEGPGTNEKTNVEVDGSDNNTGSESGFNVVTLPDTEKNQNSESTQSQASGQEESSAAADSDQDTGKPVIILSRNSVTVAYRSSFNSLAYIQDIKDDKDSYDSLFRRVVLESDVSTKRRGDYTAEMYVVDSDGNKSDVVTLHVTVE